MSPKAFSAQEKDLVRSKLIDAAGSFLATTGIRKTSVEELAHAAGISKGAFYMFYESKELLFLDALEQEQALIHDTIISRTAKASTRRDAFVAAVTEMYHSFIAKPWLLAFAGEEYELLLRRIPPERIAEHIALDNASMRRLLGLLGEGLSVSPELLSAAMRMLFMGILHRREVGEQWADPAFEFMLEALADRMFTGVKE